MVKRMLIDDTQPEETRVVVVDGNKIEDVEFESTNRKQIKGNIYLAKVMRIEPSLQAAFVDYGGNRHGFLAFGEIHPDYYHVSDELVAEIDKEVDEIIEGKKQYLKEKEAERERIRAEKARRREERLKAEAEAAAAAAREAEQASVAENSEDHTDETVAPVMVSTDTVALNEELPASLEEQHPVDVDDVSFQVENSLSSEETNSVALDNHDTPSEEVSEASPASSSDDITQSDISAASNEQDEICENTSSE